jgi:hypothetical protein
MLHKYQRMERCNLANNETDKKQGFRIGQECFNSNRLCSAEPPDKIVSRSLEEIEEWNHHPQRITICQNLTFWQNIRKHSRNHIYCSTVTLPASKNVFLYVMRLDMHCIYLYTYMSELRIVSAKYINTLTRCHYIS